MVADTITQQSALVTQWVTVTDIAGRVRTEMRWVPAAEAGGQQVETPAAVGHAA